MDENEFSNLVGEALETIPQDFVEKLDNVSIVVEDYPTTQQVRKIGSRGILLGLYEGVPKTRRGRYGIGPTLPDKITIFRIPILSLARNKSHLKDLVRNTVVHEIAHHFGMDEEMVLSAERARRLRMLN